MSKEYKRRMNIPFGIRNDHQAIYFCYDVYVHWRKMEGRYGGCRDKRARKQRSALFCGFSSNSIGEEHVFSLFSLCRISRFCHLIQFSLTYTKRIVQHNLFHYFCSQPSDRYVFCHQMIRACRRTSTLTILCPFFLCPSVNIVSGFQRSVYSLCSIYRVSRLKFRTQLSSTEAIGRFKKCLERNLTCFEWNVLWWLEISFGRLCFSDFRVVFVLFFIGNCIFFTQLFRDEFIDLPSRVVQYRPKLVLVFYTGC